MAFDKEPLPEDVLLGIAAVGGADALFEAQSRQGRGQIINNAVLPTQVLHGKGKEALERAGVKFLGLVEGDSLFQHVEFPVGWRVRPSSNPLWSFLEDANGVSRADIFYSSVPWDRDAHFSANCRYSTDTEYEYPPVKPRPRIEEFTSVVWDHTEDIPRRIVKRPSVEEHPDPIAVTGVVKDGNTIIYRTARTETNKERPYQTVGEVRELAQSWLNEHYPQWRDCTAYWEDLSPSAAVAVPSTEQEAGG